MKRLMFLVLLMTGMAAKSQTITGKVVDSTTNRQLSFAIILMHNKQHVIYTDVSGNFSIAKDSLLAGDTLLIQFLGYRKLSIPATQLYPGIIIRLVPEPVELNPIIVSNCRKTSESILNKKVKRIRKYVGPGPETRLVILSRYNNVSGKNSYLKKISVLMDEKSPNLQIPVRLRWYEWDLEHNMPGKELTDTNIVVYPYKQGWNDFEVPPHTINCPKSWIVFGLEFMYPADYVTEYKALPTTDQKIRWLANSQNRWSLAMQYVEDEHESGFFVINNGPVQQFAKKYDRYYIRPAIKFTIVHCKE